MRELLDELERWRSEGAGVGRAVVVRTFGSAPRPEGAVLLATDDGRIAGSVSGGCVEGAAFEEIERARREGRERVIRYGISDEVAWDVGLACGGTIDVLIEPTVRPEVLSAAESTAGRAVIIPLPRDAPGPAFGPHEPGPGEPPEPALLVEDGVDAPAAAPAEVVAAARTALDEGTSRTIAVGDRQYFVEAYPARPRLVIVGAVQVAIPLVPIARELGYETIVVDAREAFLTRERFPSADRLVAGWPDEVADEIGLGPADTVAVLTHDPKFDEPAIVTALRRGCRYVGAVGSRKTQADRHGRLLAAGLTEDELKRLRGPIGLDLGGKSPAETALAIMGEIVAARRGGSGIPMMDRPRVPKA
ncbi:MAG TPA: XdhC/CoxI family protein [Candidatus Limnocylindrales bacterium]|nr:XdhC/CoxI family protein [Candidatus Limnocylindrales bacterium]